jgi:DNA-repair protein XRCC1
MSEIKLKSVVSFSSQDSANKASGLLDKSSKWTGSSDKETKQFVVIQLQSPSEIKQVNIENECSAFIQLLVSNGKWDNEDEFVELLPVVSFLSPSDSKAKVNTGRAKVFTDQTSLAKDTAGKKWEFVKIVCTQPFNAVSFLFKFLE